MSGLDFAPLFTAFARGGLFYRQLSFATAWSTNSAISFF
jgi:hypothetical protein